MTTRLDLMTRVRQELNDVGPAQYVWADALLQEYLREAVREWSLVRPARRQVSMLGTVGQRDFSLTAELIPNGVVSVEWPQGVVIPVGATQPETPRWSWDIATATRPIWFYEQAYELVENGSSTTLRLRYPLPSAQVSLPLVVTFLAYYTTPQQDSDVLEVAQEDEAALVWFVCGRAYRWLDEQRARRGVFAPNVAGSGVTKSGVSLTDYEQRYASLAASRWRVRGVRNAVLQAER